MSSTSASWQMRAPVPSDVCKAIKLLTQYSRTHDGHGAALPVYDLNAPLIAARAPGRLDVMGGIADYSGSEVLQMPIAEATVALLQPNDNHMLTIRSVDIDGRTDRPVFNEPLLEVTGGKLGKDIDLPEIRDYFRRHSQGDWAAYPAGVVPVLMKHLDLTTNTGINFFVCSDVPEGKGVSSSAAIEVACMSALVNLLGVRLDASTLAILCQQVENEVVGAPCGLMDQMTSSAGRAGQLLSLLCQPATLNAPVQLPEALCVLGIDSGIRHAVSDTSYGSVRIGAFMGYRMLLDLAGIAAPRSDASAGQDHRWRGYLANVTPSEWSSEFATRVPESLLGAEFLERYTTLNDPVSQLDPARTYAVRQATAHPVYEHFRVRLFKRLALHASEDAFQLMGECLYQSHASYSACGLGSTGTDTLVERLKALGPDSGIYGARITGGGNGGTVAVLATSDAEPIIRKLANDYAADTGMGGHVFQGSSDGAAAWIVPPD